MTDDTKEITTMSDHLTLGEVDRDGAVQEAMAKVEGDSRADFLRKAAIGAGGLVGSGALLGTLATSAKAATSNDVAIANFALTLEYLESTFYVDAVASGALSGRVAEFARIVRNHELAHVAALKKMLGSAAVAKPSFNFQGTTENQAKFQKTAQVLEDTGVMAYKGQAPLIDSPAILKAALAIHSIEARHASWIRHLNGASPAPVAFDPAKSMSQVLAAVAGTKFITGAPTMNSSGTPQFTG